MSNTPDSVSMSFIVSAEGVLSLWFRRPGVPVKNFSVSTEHPHHAAIVEALKAQVKDYDTIEKLCTPATPASVAKEIFVQTLSRDFLVGKAEIIDNKIVVDGKEVNNVITDRILTFAKMGLPIDPILRFLELMLQNPDPKSQEELYDFLANRNLPLTEDGHFLAYKSIRKDWLDHHSGTIDNSIGKIIEIPRDMVDPNRRNECSYGLHVGAMQYVQNFHAGDNRRIIVVKVSPQDCVSVPQDYNHQKLRACRYEVLYELEQELKSPCYDETGEKAQSGEPPQTRDWTEGWDEDDDDSDCGEECSACGYEDCDNPVSCEEDDEEDAECGIYGENGYCDDPTSCLKEERQMQKMIDPIPRPQITPMSEIVSVQPMTKQLDMFPMEISYANTNPSDLEPAPSSAVDPLEYATVRMEQAGLNPDRFNFERHDEIAACAKEMGLVKSRDEGRKIPKTELLMLIGAEAEKKMLGKNVAVAAMLENQTKVSTSLLPMEPSETEVSGIVESLLLKDGFKKDQPGGSAFIDFVKSRVFDTMKLMLGRGTEVIPAPTPIAVPEAVIATTEEWESSTSETEDKDWESSSSCEWESSSC